MQVDKALLLKLEKLSKIKLEEDALPTIQDDLNKIIGMMEALQRVDTEGVEPLIYLSEYPIGLRTDTQGEHLNPSQALSNAPQHNGVYFKVPKMM